MDIVYSRSIGAAPPEVRELVYGDEESQLPEQRTHDSVSDLLLDTGGSAHYCHEGRWIKFVIGD